MTYIIDRKIIYYINCIFIELLNVSEFCKHFKRYQKIYNIFDFFLSFVLE